MESKIYLKPSDPKLIIRNFQHPKMEALKPEGQWVEKHPQWNRYMRFGDVIESKPIKPPQKDKTAKECN